MLGFRVILVYRIPNTAQPINWRRYIPQLVSMSFSVPIRLLYRCIVLMLVVGTMGSYMDLPKPLFTGHQT
jgi:hypothetical protein